MSAKKIDSMGQEYPETELDGYVAEAASTSEDTLGTSAISSAKEDGLSLDELLSNMDGKQDTGISLESAGAAETEAAVAAEAESGEPPAKLKRGGRKKKEDAADDLLAASVSDSATETAEDNEAGTDDSAMENGKTIEAGMAVENSKTEEAVQTTEDNESVEISKIVQNSGEAGNNEGVGGGKPMESAPQNPPSDAPRRSPRSRPAAEAPVLTIEARGEIETEQERDDIIWHEIHNAYRTRRILTGQLGGIEQTDSGKTIVIADYKGFRIVIPLKEMMIHVGRNPSGQAYSDLMLRQNKILNNMLGAQIDFVVKGIDSKSRSVVASRMEAMLKKRQTFYLDTDSSDMYRIYEGRIAQARVIAVAEKVIRVEVFGVECSIMARDLAWDWIGDAHERFSVGDEILVRILSVRRDSLEEISIRADLKSVSQDPSHENLKKCRIQSKYAGKVTDVHKGVVYVRLTNGANAVAHSCYDQRMPGKKDDVSFAVTRIDEERGVAVGIITRIIRQNL